MNCKPGDLARIVHPTLYGKFVDVMYAEPNGDYILPDGFRAISVESGLVWVCRAHGAPFDAPIKRDHSVTRKARFAAISDRWLRPIRDTDGEDETLTWCSKPVETPADVVRELTEPDHA